MPNGLSAKEFFENNVNRKNNFMRDIVTIYTAHTKSKKFVVPDSKFSADHGRLFTLEKDGDQWKRVPLSEKFGAEIFNTLTTAIKQEAVVHELYDMVERGEVFFYDRESNVPMKFTFDMPKKKESEEPVPKDQMRLGLEKVKGDARFRAINAQRKAEMAGENRRYQQHQERLAEAKELEDALYRLNTNSLVDTQKAARERASKILSITNPAPVHFDGHGEYTFKSVPLNGTSRFKPEDLETIVLAASCVDEAANETAHSGHQGLTGEEKAYQLLGAHIYQDVLIKGRASSVENIVPVVEKGREIAGRIIQKEIDGDAAELKDVLMTGLRRNIQAAREQSTLEDTTLRIYEETAKLARLIHNYQLYDNQDEFLPLLREAEAMDQIAKMYLAGAEAKKELHEAYTGNGFKDEVQRQNIVGRIMAQRYLNARLSQSQKGVDNDPAIQEVSREQTELTKLEIIGKEEFLEEEQNPENTGEENELTEAPKKKISREEYLLQEGQLQAKRTKVMPRRDNVQEIMDALKVSGNAVSNQYRDFAMLTADGQELLKAQTPLDMIKAVNKLATADSKTKGNLDAFVEDMQDKIANRMDIRKASAFWERFRSNLAAHFDPQSMPSDYDRLVIQKRDEKGNLTLVKLDAEVGLGRKELRGITMNEAAIMEKIREQIDLGNVYLYKRGSDVPNQLFMGDNDVPGLDKNPVQPVPDPGLWARFFHFISGGRLYREECEPYHKANHLLSDAVKTDRSNVKESELSEYETIKKARKAEANKQSFLKTVETSLDMPTARKRAHNILSLDNPAEVSFLDKQTYKGTPYPITAELKGPFTDEALDALCLAGISSHDAAQAYMDQGGKVVGTTAKTTADALEGHVYNDILVAGRDGSHVFFPLVDAGRKVAFEALQDYANNKPQKLAQLLGHAIEAAVYSGRYDESVKSNAALGVEMALRMMSMLEKHPGLMEHCGIDKETLTNYKAELTGLQMIGEAYERAGNAQQKLADAARNNRTLTQEESLEIATDMLTYEYLNSIQVNANMEAGSRSDIMDLRLMDQMKTVMLDEDGNRMNPVSPQKPVKETRKLTEAEGRDLRFEMKMLFDQPLTPIILLCEGTLNQFRSHVMNTPQVQNMGKHSDPMALVGALGDKTVKNALFSEVNKVRKKPQLSKKPVAEVKKEDPALNQEVQKEQSTMKNL